ncbi:MAG: cytochrome c [Flavobacteriales bacterium]|jgi:cytochrome c551/c552|nr:cytochrome c [Flavobacteriales bacterium]
MRNIPTLLFIFASFLMISCGGSDAPKKEKRKIPKSKTKKKAPKKKSVTKTIPASKTVDMVSKGVGPISSLKLPETVDQKMAKEGEKIFARMCAACHKTDKRFIGPMVKDITKRRTPEWIMNMILNPNEMVQKDDLAKRLLMEFNGAPMANQNLTEKQARAVLEYFRTL